MKHLTPFTLGITLLSLSLSAGLSAETLPGQVDFGEFTPPGKGGEYVEVNLSSSLISLASRFVEKSEPEVARLLSGLKLVRVNVISLNDENRADIQKRADKLRKQLDGKGWERVVLAQEKDQDVSVYLKTQNKDTIQGLVVLVTEGNKQAVFVNIVGDIKPEQLAMLGDQLHIDPLKKLGHPAEKAEEKGSAEKTEKSDK